MPARYEIKNRLESSEIPPQITPVLVSGLPGKVATLVAEEITRSKDFVLLGYGMGSQANVGTQVLLQYLRITLLDSSHDLRRSHKVPYDGIAVDYSTPDAATDNAILFANSGIPFVMGTTGVDRLISEAAVQESNISAVIAPNMAPSVVAFLDHLKTLRVDGFRFRITESHQASKRDVSGTAREIKAILERKGAVMEAEIESIRDIDRQKEIGVKNLSGHAYHWLTLTGMDGREVRQTPFELKIDGRAEYVRGTLMAMRFLRDKIAQGSEGIVYSMSDVLAGS